MSLFSSRNPWSPVKRETVTEWAGSNRFLTSATSYRTGPWDNELAPYVKEIQDCLSADHPCKKVVFKKSIQVAGTEIALNAIGQRMANNPSPIMVVLPNDTAAKSWAQLRIDPMIDASPQLTEIMNRQTRKQVDSVKEKTYPGGYIRIAAATSTTDLKSIAIDLVVCDEIDEFPIRLGRQGCPIAMIEGRLTTFPEAKAYYVSSPTDKETSRICKEFEKGNQKHLYINCPAPHCQHQQEILWENIKYENNDASTAKWQCKECMGLFDESYKAQMLKTCEWIPHAPENGEEVQSFTMGAFYSPFKTWVSCVEDWLAALKDPVKMAGFTNMVRGEPTENITVKPPTWLEVYRRREDYDIRTIPKGVHVLTCATDIQGDRFESEIFGWGPNYENWSIDYFVHHGDPKTTAFWDALEEYYARAVFQTHDGYDITLSKAVVDTGDQTAYVYDFLRRFDHLDVVVGIKGQHSISQDRIISTHPTLVDKTVDDKVDKEGVHIYMVNTSLVKELVIGWLSNEPDEEGIKPIGLSHFPSAYPPHYFEMLTSEYMSVEYVKGKPQKRWIMTPGVRNEALDLRVYNRAALEMIGTGRWNAADWEIMRTRTPSKVQSVQAATAHHEDNPYQSTRVYPQTYKF